MKRSCDMLLPGHKHCTHGHVEDCPNPGECSVLPNEIKLWCKCMDSNCLKEHYADTLDDEEEDKSWPPKTMETK